MKSEIQELINLIEKSLNLFSEIKNLKDLKSRLAELEAISNNPDFWKNSNKAKVIMKEKQSIEKNISTYICYHCSSIWCLFCCSSRCFSIR